MHLQTEQSQLPNPQKMHIDLLHRFFIDASFTGQMASKNLQNPFLAKNCFPELCAFLPL